MNARTIVVRNVMFDTTVYGAALEKGEPASDEEEKRKHSYACLDLADAGILVPFSISVIGEELAETPVERLRQQLLELYAKLPVVELMIEQKALELAKYYEERLGEGKVTKDDALILAVASVNRLDAVISWNRRHLANEQTRKVVRKVNGERGLPTPLILTPKELVVKGSYTPASRGVLYG